MIATSDTSITYGINGKSYTENPSNPVFDLGTFNNQPFKIGAVFQGDAEGFTGDLGELIIVGSATDTDTTQKLEGYLAWKWGLQ